MLYPQVTTLCLSLLLFVGCVNVLTMKTRHVKLLDQADSLMESGRLQEAMNLYEQVSLLILSPLNS